MKQIETAVLFLIFNRADTARRVFGAIREARPRRLYIASDGARAEKAGEQASVEALRAFVLSSIDWPCEVNTLFRKQNLGCKRAVSGAIDWFFEHEGEGIILEDDVLPVAGFFSFCSELLSRYRHDDRIGCITGSNLIYSHQTLEDSYFFSHYANIWGWATWKRVWEKYDVGLTDWPRWSRSRELQRFSDGERYFSAYWKDQIDAVYNGKTDTWDFQFFLTCWRNDLLTIVPAKNLTSNLGFGKDATHTTGGTPRCVLDSPASELDMPLRHPSRVERNVAADRLINQEVYSIGIFTILKWKLRRVPIIGSSLSKVKKMMSGGAL